MKKYDIIYHIFPDGEDILLTIPARSKEEAIAFAKRYRKDGFSIREHSDQELIRN